MWSLALAVVCDANSIQAMSAFVICIVVMGTWSQIQDPCKEYLTNINVFIFIIIYMLLSSSTRCICIQLDDLKEHQKHALAHTLSRDTH